MLKFPILWEWVMFPKYWENPCWEGKKVSNKMYILTIIKQCSIYTVVQYESSGITWLYHGSHKIINNIIKGTAYDIYKIFKLVVCKFYTLFNISTVFQLCRWIVSQPSVLDDRTSTRFPFLHTKLPNHILGIEPMPERLIDQSMTVTTEVVVCKLVHKSIQVIQRII